MKTADNSTTKRAFKRKKRAAPLSREAESTLHHIVENSSHLFYIHTADHVLTYVSPQSRQFFDCAPEEALVRWTELITDHPVNQAAIEITQRAIDTGLRQPPYEIECLSRSGRKIWVEVNETPLVENGRTVAIVGSLTDITVRKQVEEELRRSEERYRRLYNDTPVMLHSIDHEGRLVSVSNYWLETLGYTRDEVLGRKTSEFLTEASKRYAKEVVLPAFFQTGSCHEVAYQFVKKNGEVLDILLSAIAERNDEGEVIRSLAVMIDVTERKRAEKEIEKLNADLAARAVELENAYRELETFSYSVSHDLRKPLTLINGYAQVIEDLYGKDLHADCRGYLQEISAGAIHLSDLIEALLKFSSATAGELHRETVDLSEIAYDVACDLALAEPGRLVRFRIANGISVSGDARLLRVVLENLFSNAWKYTAGREEATIEFGVTEHDGKTTCFVRDNGTGFDMAHAAKLFTPFQRLHEATKFKGHGIGLATVERIIRRHGGRIWAEGEPDRGATFWFTL